MNPQFNTLATVLSATHFLPKEDFEPDRTPNNMRQCISEAANRLDGRYLTTLMFATALWLIQGRVDQVFQLFYLNKKPRCSPGVYIY